MAYEMSGLLMKCDVPDFSLLVGHIDSYVNMSSDAELKRLLSSYEESKSDSSKEELVRLLEREIRYLGSADIAYAWRKLTSDEEPAGVSIYEIIDDVSKKQKVKQKLVGGVEAKIERIVKVVVERTFFAMTPEEQRELLTKRGIRSDQQEALMERLKNNKTLLLPILLSILGRETTQKLVVGLATTAVAAILGRKAAEELIKRIVEKFPLWAEWLGPIVWGISLSWLAIDLQGAAYRKTIPIIIYLGIVGLRDGPEDGGAFWAAD